MLPTHFFSQQFVSALSEMQIRGKADVIRGIQTATLALKHRQNKNQKQRIVCFVGSPVEATVGFMICISSTFSTPFSTTLSLQRPLPLQLR